jgi:hypothetical protein
MFGKELHYLRRRQFVVGGQSAFYASEFSPKANLFFHLRHRETFYAFTTGTVFEKHFSLLVAFPQAIHSLTSAITCPFERTFPT